MKTFIKSLLKRSTRQAVVLSMLSLGGIIGAVSPAQAASIHFDTGWTSTGDTLVSPNQAELTNSAGAGDDNGTDRRVSETNAVTTFGVETFLNLNPGTIDFNFSEGSAIARTFNNIAAGDRLSFDLTFDLLDSGDNAFVAIGNQISYFSTNTTFDYTFPNDGNYTVGIGVLDFNDTIRSSRVRVTNANLQPVPEPLTILGSMTALGLGTKLRQRLRKQ